MTLTTSLGYTPTFSVSIGDTDISSNLADRLISLRIESNDGGGDADTVDFALDDRDWLLASPSIGDGSESVSVTMGYVETGAYAMGTFALSEVTNELPVRTMRLHGNSIDFASGAKAPMIQSFSGQTLGTIIGAIATTAGVTASVDPTIASVVVPYLNQYASSMHLLTDLERTYDGMLSS